MRKGSLRAENESLKTNQEHVKTRTFSAETAEKIRHPAGFNRAGVHSGAAREDSPPAYSNVLKGNGSDSTMELPRNSYLWARTIVTLRRVESMACGRDGDEDFGQVRPGPATWIKIRTLYRKENAKDAAAENSIRDSIELGPNAEGPATRHLILAANLLFFADQISGKGQKP
jgi:hypothetical protein